MKYHIPALLDISAVGCIKSYSAGSMRGLSRWRSLLTKSLDLVPRLALSVLARVSQFPAHQQLVISFNFIYLFFVILFSIKLVSIPGKDPKTEK